MEKQSSDIWFPAKLYGWGWGLPVNWKGWIVLLVYIGLVLLLTSQFSPETDLVSWLSYFVPLTLVLIVICWLKGEKPKWRWGK